MLADRLTKGDAARLLQLVQHARVVVAAKDGDFPLLRHLVQVEGIPVDGKNELKGVSVFVVK